MLFFEVKVVSSIYVGKILKSLFLKINQPIFLENKHYKNTYKMRYSIMFPQKIKYTITICSSNSTFGYMPKTIEKRDLNKYLHTNVHNSIIQ